MIQVFLVAGCDVGTQMPLLCKHGVRTTNCSMMNTGVLEPRYTGDLFNEQVSLGTASLVDHLILVGPAAQSVNNGGAAHFRAHNTKSEIYIKTADIIVDDVAYCHPYPSNPKAQNVWKYFRCKRGVEYSQQGHCLYCMECCSQQIHGDKLENKNYIFYSNVV